MAHFRNEIRQRQRLHHEMPLAGVGQHLPSEVRGLFAGADDAVEQLDRGIVGRQDLLGQAGIADHADQEVVEVVSHASRQQTQAFRFLRLAQALFGLAHGFLRAFSLEGLHDGRRDGPDGFQVLRAVAALAVADRDYANGLVVAS